MTALGRSGLQVSRLTTVLFGATRPDQVSANLGALALADRLTPEERDRLAAIGVRRLPAGQPAPVGWACAPPRSMPY
jgi:hypothetical protein